MLEVKMSELLKEETPVRERFTVDNDMKAEWVLGKIRHIRADQKKEKDELTRQMQFYRDQMDLIDKQADDEVAFFESMLLPYFRERQDAGFTKETKTQISYKLPTGKMMIKHQAPEYERNNSELLPWLKENRPELVKVEESPNWAELKKSIKVVGGSVTTEDGELVPGVKVTEREDRFEVEVN
jgi:hypothetical protein